MYVAPSVEVMEVMVELGFNGSNGDGTFDNGFGEA